MPYVHFLRLRAVNDRPYRGRILSATYEDGDTISYAYDNSGRLATVIG